MLLRGKGSAAGGSRKARKGFTLVELVIVMVLLSVVGLALTMSLVKQQRFYRGSSEIMEMRGQLRLATEILASELRGISASGGDIYTGSMGSTSVEFRSTFGTSMACAIPALNQIRIPPNENLAAGHRLTFLGNAPTVGHAVFILDEGATTAMNDDVWLVRTITAVSALVNPCNGTSYTAAGDATKSGYQITLDADLPNTTTVGTLVRLAKRVRYGLYSASNGLWYLGYCESTTMANPCNTLEPVAGPFNAENTDGSAGTSGLNFYYYDENGATTTNRLLVAGIDVAVRGSTQNWVSRYGEAGKKFYSDTARIMIGVRNRR